MVSVESYSSRTCGRGAPQAYQVESFKATTKSEEKVQELILRVLLVASDAQTVTDVLCIGPTCAYQV